MPYDESLAARISDALRRRKGITPRKMFGGIGYLLDGHMLVGVWKDSLIARVGPDDYDDALREPHAREFNITGRPMKGWVMVGPEGLDSARLADWVRRAARFVKTLSPK